MKNPGKSKRECKIQAEIKPNAAEIKPKSRQIQSKIKPKPNQAEARIKTNPIKILVNEANSQIKPKQA